MRVQGKIVNRYRSEVLVIAPAVSLKSLALTPCGIEARNTNLRQEPLLIHRLTPQMVALPFK